VHFISISLSLIKAKAFIAQLEYSSSCAMAHFYFLNKHYSAAELQLSTSGDSGPIFPLPLPARSASYWTSKDKPKIKTVSRIKLDNTEKRYLIFVIL
jgi:hypothetical protein